MKTLYILAGANGSGKSTIAKELLPEEKIVYVNADDIARELCPENMQAVRIQAGKELHARINKLFSEGKSFALESTLSGVGHIKTIQIAHKLGYQVVIIYTFVDNPEVCIGRIQMRVKNGGHPVPKEDVIPMWVADMDFETAPSVIEALKERIEHPILGYSVLSERYVNAIASWQKDHYGTEGVKEEVHA